MKYIKRFNAAVDNGLPKAVFDHLRNYLMCSFLLAVGISEAKQPMGLLFGLVPAQYPGVALIGLSFILTCLNLYEGIRKISKYKYHSILTLGLIITYVIISMRVIALAWNFRVSS